jgi:hypothetical protein
MDALPVRTMTPDEEGPAIAIMVLAFAADPIMRWAWPHIHRYMAAMPRFVRASGGGAFAHGAGYCTNDCTGAALCLPPGVGPDDDRLDELMASTASPAAREAGRAIFHQAQYPPPGRAALVLATRGRGPGVSRERSRRCTDGVRARAM